MTCSLASERMEYVKEDDIDKPWAHPDLLNSSWNIPVPVIRYNPLDLSRSLASSSAVLPCCWTSQQSILITGLIISIIKRNSSPGTTFVYIPTKRQPHQLRWFHEDKFQLDFERFIKLPSSLITIVILLLLLLLTPTHRPIEHVIGQIVCN